MNFSTQKFLSFNPPLQSTSSHQSPPSHKTSAPLIPLEIKCLNFVLSRHHWTISHFSLSLLSISLLSLFLPSSHSLPLSLSLSLVYLSIYVYINLFYNFNNFILPPPFSQKAITWIYQAQSAQS